MQFQREQSFEIFDEAMPLLRQHFEEISANKDIPLDPDFEAYELMERQGMLRTFTARDDGKLVGYAVFFVRANIHYKTSKQANQDILYIVPSLRGGLLGYRFIKWCDEELRAEGCQAVYQHIKAAHNFGSLLERIGYRLVDLIYCRRLD